MITEFAVRFVRDLSARPDVSGNSSPTAARLPEWYGQGRIEPREGGTVSLMGGHINGVVTLWRPEKLLGYTWNVLAPGEATPQVAKR